MSTTREQIIETTCILLEAQGYHATGLNQILKESDAPKGSLYYYFPEGKEELVSEAIERAGKLVAERIRVNLAVSNIPADAVRKFVYEIARNVEASGFRAGGPLTTVAMETATSSERLNQACRAAYAQIVAAFEEKLLVSGFAKKRAAQLAVFITAAIEGGTILSRVEHSDAPLCEVAQELSRLLAA
jgi:TetR/AcrR family transcriptional repressor of lmrAB and yxaGH operons